jgi:hypothetical protein
MGNPGDIHAYAFRILGTKHATIDAGFDSTTDGWTLHDLSSVS